MKKVYLFLANGFETIEALTVVDMLRRAGKDIVTVSINDTTKVVSAHRIAVEADTIFEGHDFSDAYMYVIPGGIPGTPNLKAHAGLSSLIDNAAKNGVKLAAICAGPSILGSKGLLKGKKAVCFPGIEDELIGAEVLDETVVTDGDIITARGMGATIEFAMAILSMMGDDDAAKKVGNTIQFSQYYKKN